MEPQRILLRSTRGVAQEFDLRVEPVAGGYFVKSQLRIDGCFPRSGPCMLTPLPFEAAMMWANARTVKLARSAAAFRPVKTFEDQIEELFFGFIGKL